MVMRLGRLLFLVIMATVLVSKSMAHLGANSEAYQCYCGNYFAGVYDYSDNLLASNFGQNTETPGFTVFSMASCGSYCQNWIWGIGHGLCSSQGFGSGQGYVKLNWYYIWSNADIVSYYGEPDGNPQQYDCGDI